MVILKDGTTKQARRREADKSNINTAEKNEENM